MGENIKQLSSRGVTQKYDNGIGKKLHLFASSASPANYQAIYTNSKFCISCLPSPMFLYWLQEEYSFWGHAFWLFHGYSQSWIHWNNCISITQIRTQFGPHIVDIPKRPDTFLFLFISFFSLGYNPLLKRCIYSVSMCIHLYYHSQKLFHLVFLTVILNRC